MTEHRNIHRGSREYIAALCAGVLAASLILANGCATVKKSCSTTAVKVPFAMPEIKPPSFPDRTFDIREYGAVGDRKTMNTKAFADAVAACANAGGGRVLVPAGRWLTGPIHLKSNINLHIEKGAEIVFSTNFADYLPVVFTRFEGTECYNYSPLIYARDCTNIAITGPGKLNGQGHVWWPWVRDGQDRQGIDKLRGFGAEGVPVEKRVFGNKEDALRPSFIQPINCKNVLIEGFTITNGPMWTIHPVYCENVIVRKISVKTEGYNGDGINPDSCKNVLIEDCYFDTEDDCIVMKSGRDEDGRRVGRPCENIVIRNCRTKRGHGGVVIGSEMSGGVRNVFIHDCHFDGTDRGIRIKSMRGRGGVVENIWIQDVTMGRIKDQAIRMNMFYNPTPPEPVSERTPRFRNIHIRNVTCRQAKVAMQFIGLPEMPIENITLENISIAAERGLSCTNAKNVKLINVDIATRRGPVMLLKDSQDITIRKSSCRRGTKTFLRLEGGKTRNIRLSDNNLANAQRDVVLGKDVRNDAVIRQ